MSGSLRVPASGRITAVTEIARSAGSSACMQANAEQLGRARRRGGATGAAGDHGDGGDGSEADEDGDGASYLPP